MVKWMLSVHKWRCMSTILALSRLPGHRSRTGKQSQIHFPQKPFNIVHCDVIFLFIDVGKCIVTLSQNYESCTHRFHPLFLQIYVCVSNPLSCALCFVRLCDARNFLCVSVFERSSMLKADLVNIWTSIVNETHANTNKSISDISFTWWKNCPKVFHYLNRFDYNNVKAAIRILWTDFEFNVSPAMFASELI